MKRALPLALAVLAGAACNRVEREGGAGPRADVELRDAQGGVRLGLYRTREGYRWQDAQQGEGRFAAAEGAWSGHDAQRGPLTVRAPSPGALEVRGSGGVLLDLRRVDGLLRLGDGAGIPIARVRDDRGEALAHDAGGMLVARARKSGGRIVIADRDGATLGFIVGEVPLERAALASLPTLSAGERAALLLIR
jgi:hypothetical protein